VKKPPLINGVKKLLEGAKEFKTGIWKDCYLLPACVSQYFRDPYLKIGKVKKKYYQVNLFGEIELFVFHPPSCPHK
jgi:hypothetical protein